MAMTAYTLTAPAAPAKSLASLITALSGRPTISMAGVSYPLPAGRASQLTIQSAPGNALNVYTGMAGLTTTANVSAVLTPGASQNFGNGVQTLADLSQVFLLGSGAETVYVTVID